MRRSPKKTNAKQSIKTCGKENTTTMATENNVFSKRLAAAAILIPVAAAVLVFFNSLHGNFVYDDNSIVVNQPLVKDLSALGIADIFTHKDLSRSSPHYLPVRLISYAIDYRLWKLNPLGFHLTNLFLHVLNVILATLFVASAAAAAGIKERKNVWLAAGATGLLFAVHPLQSESVAWVSGRKELLCTGFLLCAALCYLSSLRRPVSKKTDWAIPSGLVFFTLAILSKATAAAFPLALVGFEIFMQPGEGRAKTAQRAKRFVPFLIVDAVIVYIDMKYSAQAGMIKEVASGSLAAHYLTCAATPLLYIGKAFWPAKLSVEYGTTLSRGELMRLAPAAVLFWGGLVLLWTKYRKRQGAAAALAAWAVAGLLPVINLVPSTKLIADRYFYLPSIGLFGALCIAIAQIKGKAPRIAAAVILVAAACAFGFRAAERNLDWRNEMTLWSSAMRFEPDHPLVLQNLAYAYYLDKDYVKAEKYYKASIKRDPKNVPAYVNLAVLEYVAWKRTDETISLLQQAVRLDPKNIPARINLAMAYYSSGEFQAAVDEMISAIDNDPGNILLVRKLYVLTNTLKSKHLRFVIPKETIDRINALIKDSQKKKR